MNTETLYTIIGLVAIACAVFGIALTVVCERESNAHYENLARIRAARDAREGRTS